MVRMIGKKYTFQPDKFLEMCKEIYVPETITKVTCPNGHDTKSKFCGECGHQTTNETIIKKVSDKQLIETVFDDELDPNGCWRVSNITSTKSNIIVFQDLFADKIFDDYGFCSIETIKNTKDESVYKELFEKYSEKIEDVIYVY